MKKNILFVIPNLGCGGAEKSLVTLLNCIDYKKYEVDLYLFEQTGTFINMVPKEVNILSVSNYWAIINSSFKDSIKQLLKDKRFDLILARGMQTLICRKYKNAERIGQGLWKYIKGAFQNLDKEYDAAIGYLEQNPIYFVIDKVKAKKKIGWIHSSLDKFKLDYKIEENYLQELDYIVTVSRECADVLKRLFIRQAEKIKVIENIMLSSLINKMSNEIILRKDLDNIKIVTVARLEEPKGIDVAIEACYLLAQEGYKFTWSIIGDGAQRSELEYRMKHLNLEDVFFLEGIKSNPYPYIKNADIYVQPSRFEGKSIAIEEAKILAKSIVVTDYNTVTDQIIDGVTGIIVKCSSNGIYSGIKRLIDNPDTRDRLSNNLLVQKFSNETEINKLYSLIEGE